MEDKFRQLLLKNPPSNEDMPSYEELLRAKRNFLIWIFLTVIVLLTSLFISNVIFEQKLEKILTIVLVLFVTLYFFFKRANRKYLLLTNEYFTSLLTEYIEFFDPNSWYIYVTNLYTYIVMRKDSCLMSLVFPVFGRSYHGQEVRLLVCRNFTERKVRIRDKVFLGMGKFLAKKIEKFDVYGSKNERYIFEVLIGECTIPLDKGTVATCNNCLILRWYSAFLHGLALSPVKVAEILGKYLDLL